MKFTEWLHANSGTDEDLQTVWSVVASTYLEGWSGWDRLRSMDDAKAFSRKALTATDEVADLIGSAWQRYISEAGNPATEAEEPDPMGQPYAPGARTTLADARLQVVCAVIAGGCSTFDGRESVDEADKILDAMRRSS